MKYILILKINLKFILINILSSYNLIFLKKLNYLLFNNFKKFSIMNLIQNYFHEFSSNFEIFFFINSK